jgi:hypothetical protein
VSRSSSVEQDFFAAFASIVIGGLLLFFIPIFLVAAFVAALIFVTYKIVVNSNMLKEYKARRHTQELYERACSVTSSIPDREDFVDEIHNRLPTDLPEPVVDALLSAARHLYDLERFDSQIPPPPAICNSIEGARYRDFLADYSAKVRHPAIADLALDTILASFHEFLSFLPPSHIDEDPFASISIEQAVPDVREPLQALILSYYADEIKQAGLFQALTKQLDRNAQQASYAVTRSQNADLILPVDFDGDNPVFTYLKDTPLLDIFDARIPFSIPDELRFEHTYVLAPPGTGKTQLIQHLFLQDLEHVKRDEASILVMDSQSDLINQIRSLKVFAPDEPLHDKLIIIEPDVDFPLALNIFDMGRGYDKTHSAKDAERLTNNALDLLTYVFSSLLGDGGSMTAKQTTLYRYVVRLLIQIPNATINTFAEILQDGVGQYDQYVCQLDPPAQNFFHNQFNERDFNQTKQALAWRLSLLLESTVFSRIFSSTESKLDLFAELNSSKVILINTDRDFLGDTRTGVFGRFFIALLLAASQARAALPRANRLPVYCYIDEAHDYISSDPKITVILDQARKMKVAMLLAHQRTSQIDSPNVLDALLTTSIKFAHTDNDKDARLLARAMNTTHDFIKTQSARHFAVHARKHTSQAVSLAIPFLVMEKMDKMTPEKQEAVRDVMRLKYATHYAPQPDTNYPEAASNAYPMAAEDEEPYKPKDPLDPDEPFDWE